ncbi:MAG: hypothetical protein ACPGXK_11310 [Phycisphaerae bacterium]
MNIQSGTSNERIARSLAIFALAAGFAGYFFYDGFIGYPQNNVRTVFERVLGSEVPDPLPSASTGVNRAAAQNISEGMPLADVEARLGKDFTEKSNQRIYFGEGGYVEVNLSASAVKTASWVEGPEHSPVDIMTQKALGAGLSLVALYLLVKLIRVATTRGSVSPNGLQLAGRPVIPFNNIEDIKKGPHGDDYDIHIRDGENTSVVRVERYVYARLPEMIGAICEQTGINNPDQSPS